MKICSLVLALCGLFSPGLSDLAMAATPAAANSVCSFITADRVNIRQAPNLNAPVVVQLNRGDGVRATRRQGSWVEIVQRVEGFPPNEQFFSLKGWVSNQFINGCSEDQFDRWR